MFDNPAQDRIMFHGSEPTRPYLKIGNAVLPGILVADAGPVPIEGGKAKIYLVPKADYASSATVKEMVDALATDKDEQTVVLVDDHQWTIARWLLMIKPNRTANQPLDIDDMNSALGSLDPLHPMAANKTKGITGAVAAYERKAEHRAASSADIKLQLAAGPTPAAVDMALDHIALVFFTAEGRRAEVVAMGTSSITFVTPEQTRLRGTRTIVSEAPGLPEIETVYDENARIDRTAFLSRLEQALNSENEAGAREFANAFTNFLVKADELATPALGQALHEVGKHPIIKAHPEVAAAVTMRLTNLGALTQIIPPSRTATR